MRPSTFLRKSGVVVLSAAAVIVFVGLSACGGGGGSTPTVNDLTILPGTVSVPQGGTAQFSALLSGAVVSATWQASAGTITSAGLFTAPTSSNGVQITATSGSNTGTITVNIVAAQPLAVGPSAIALPAGQGFTFTATGTNNPVTWSVSAPNGGNPGTIDSNGNYTPPLFPPPGQAVTVTATSGANSGTSNVLILYSNATLNGTYSFAYTGDDGSGFFTVAGSFPANGNGTIGSGVEDEEDLGGVNQDIAISGGSYTVNADGRTAINFTAGGSPVVLQATLTTNQHGLVIRYDNQATGSGTIDQQNTADFNVTGPYVFSLSGADSFFNPLGFAGKFTASAGSIPNLNAIVDVNDGGDVNNNCPSGNCNVAPGDPDTSLSGSYSLDQNNLPYGRGTITLNATNFGTFLPSGTQASFAFYIIDHTHLHVVEIDSGAFTGGDIYEGLLGPGFGVGVIPKGNYPITLGGTSTQGAYAAGGIFAANGTGSVSGGVFDNNSGGNPINKGLTINECAYGTGYSPNGVDQGTGRVDLLLSFSSGTGCGTPNHSVDEFALYPTALMAPSAVMLEIDNNFITGGDAYAQQGSAVSPTGSFAFNLTGQGIFHNQQGSYQQDAVGQLVFSGTAITGGNVNINNYGSIFPSATVVTNSTTLGAVSGSFGRGTMKLTLSVPQGGGTPVYNMAYYYVDPSTYLLIDLDNNRIANGIIADQF
jgi:hypothetical protein